MPRAKTFLCALCSSTHKSKKSSPDTNIRLGFNRTSIGRRHIHIDLFSEHIFAYLFKSETTFSYNPLQRKYQCYFEGVGGGQKLGLLLNYSNWDTKYHKNGRTRGYVCMNNSDEKYKIKFLWRENKLQQESYEFLCGSLVGEFYVTSGDFIEHEFSNPTLQSENAMLGLPLEFNYSIHSFIEFLTM
ncbi:11213_t:CDS:2 [Funneliformis caledonium]|uniref:11213_t:CDS:1 n=1 Tax=Funneliformis caledonium TaxID=1117310 RepID=A0A9N9ALA7_9GLOM|nr:11213_t:CDS:2 [Funneliformis caledonium]